LFLFKFYVEMPEAQTKWTINYVTDGEGPKASAYGPIDKQPV